MAKNYDYLNAEDLEGVGIKLASKRFHGSGETRAQLRCTLPGDIEIQTGVTMGGEPGWQKSHKHEHAFEHYIVHSGWLLIVTEDDAGQLWPHFLGPNRSLVVPPGEPHNVFVGPGAVFFAARTGKTKKVDRIDLPQFDAEIIKEWGEDPSDLEARFKHLGLAA